MRDLTRGKVGLNYGVQIPAKGKLRHLRYTRPLATPANPRTRTNPDYGTIGQCYQVRTYREGDEAAWASIINASFGGDKWNAEKCRQDLTSCPQFDPEGLFFVLDVGQRTACAWRQSADEGKVGYVHMLGVTPEHQGKGLGYALVLRALHFFKDGGFQEVVLDTDDFRLPAIKTYLNLGFKPVYVDESHHSRWEAVLAKVEEARGRKRLQDR